MSNFKRRFDRDSISDESKNFIEGTSDNAKVDAQGIAGDNLFEPIPQYLSTPCENVISNKNNAWIVLGRDRPSSRLSGYGGKGHTQCGSIDLVVGRMGSEVKSVDENGEQIWTDPDFEKDSARIYISQKAEDIDGYFKIDGEATKIRSAIGIKADQVRVIAREKIKLVTGTDDINSQGADINDFEGIELQAGNDSDSLEPMVLGDSLTNQQEDLIGLVDNLAGIVDSLTMTLFEFQTVVASHFHLSPFFAVPTSPSETLIPAGQKHCLELLGKVKRSILSLKVNLAQHKLNYLQEIGENFICSRRNKVN